MKSNEPPTNPAPADPPPNPRPKVGVRKRLAHWRVEIDGVTWRFAFDPSTNQIAVRRRCRREVRVISAKELIDALKGQRLLPL